MAESVVVTVKSYAPKSNPETVVEAPPVAGIFLSTWDTTDASKVNISTTVPAAAPTVTATRFRGGKAKAVPLQATDVAELQETEEQTASEKAMDTVNSPFPKFNPVTVTEALPVTGKFNGEADTLGPSNEYRAKLVPTIEPTVTEFDDKPNAT